VFGRSLHRRGSGTLRRYGRGTPWTGRQFAPVWSTRWSRDSVEREPNTTSGDLIGGLGKSALTSAIVYGVSAAVPPFGAFAIPAYGAFGYGKLGYNLYKAYVEWRERDDVRPATLKASGSLAGVGSQTAADGAASYLVAAVGSSGLLSATARQTRIDRTILSEMLRGSTSSALSGGAEELKKLVLGKAVGA